jgi:hypothetical protein
MTVVHLDPERNRRLAACRRIMEAIAPNHIASPHEAIVLLIHATAAVISVLPEDNRDELNEKCIDIFRRALADDVEDEAS